MKYTSRYPLKDEEIRELLGATLHGPLPEQTMQRVLATLAEVPELRAANMRTSQEIALDVYRSLSHLFGSGMPIEGFESIIKSTVVALERGSNRTRVE